jgi:very-short-patch-repair endonuclease
VNTPLIAILIALVVIVAAFSVLGARLERRDASLAKPWPLEEKRQVLTERERALYQRLVQALPNHIVLAQAHLRQVLGFQRGRRSQSIANSVNQLSLDFLILNPDTSIVAAVELDDATHSRDSRRQADARKSHALSSAGVPLIRWNAKSLPDTTAILAALPAKRAATQPSI